MIKGYSEESWKKAVIETASVANSMLHASIILGVGKNTYKRWAIKYDVWNPNPGGRGIDKKWDEKATHKIPLSEILDGNHPNYQTLRLKKRLFDTGIKENKCEECGIDSWNNKSLNCHLDHIDGNPRNHKLENLRIICPNCHSQTPTYSGRNKTTKLS